MNKTYKKKLTISLLFGMIFFSDNAYAYINPSIFSMVSLALAGFFGVIGFYYYRIVDAIKSILKKAKSLVSKH